TRRQLRPIRAEFRWSALRAYYSQSPLPADTSFRKALFRAYRQQLAILFSKSSFLLSEFGSAQTRSTLGSRGQRSMVCARSFLIETWPRLPCPRGTKSTAATLAGKNLPSVSFRGAFGCGGRRRVRRGAQCKHRELATERCIILQGSIAAHSRQP